MSARSRRSTATRRGPRLCLAFSSRLRRRQPTRRHAHVQGGDWIRLGGTALHVAIDEEEDGEPEECHDGEGTNRTVSREIIEAIEPLPENLIARGLTHHAPCDESSRLVGSARYPRRSRQGAFWRLGRGGGCRQEDRPRAGAKDSRTK